MALPYPEGAVFFRRSALRLQGYGYNFDVQRDTDFYTHFLLENVWNYWAFSPNTNPSVSNPPTHPRSRVLTGTASSYRTRFGVWDKTNVMFSNQQSGRDYFHIVSLDNNQNYNELRDYDRGGPAKTILRPVPLVDARYMVIDWLNPFRAIYLPLAHQAGEGFEDLCVYLMIDFRLRQNVDIFQPSWGFARNVSFDRERGLTYRHNEVLSFDLKGIYEFLMIPPQMRAPEMGLYKTERRGDELITMFDAHRPTPRNARTVTRQFVRHIDLVTVINNNFGVDVTWQPYQHSNWVVNFFAHVTTLALGFVPVVGPLLSVSFSVAMQIILDPDAFREQNPLNLAASIVAALIDSGNQARKNVHRGHQRSSGMLLLFKGKPAELTNSERPYVQNLGFKPETEDEGKELEEQKAEDEGDPLAEAQGEDQWEETVEQQVDLEGEGAAKPGAEHEEKQIAEPQAKDEGEQIIQPGVREVANPNPEQTPGGGYPFPEVNAEEEAKGNVEEKTEDKGNQIASQSDETEKKLDGEHGVESKETAVPEQKAEDKKVPATEPESKDAISQPEEEKANDENNQTGQDVGKEKKLDTEQSAEGEETTIPEQEAEDQGARVVEPGVEDAVNHPGEEKAKDEGNKTADQTIEHEPKIADPTADAQEEANPAAEPKPELEPTEPKADPDSQPTNHPLENETKIADPTANANAQDEKPPATEPKANNEETNPTEPKTDSETQPTNQTIEDETKTADPTGNTTANPAPEPEVEPKTADPTEPEAHDKDIEPVNPPLETEPKTADHNAATEPTANKLAGLETQPLKDEPHATDPVEPATEPKDSETPDANAGNEGKQAETGK